MKRENAVTLRSERTFFLETLRFKELKENVPAATAKSLFHVIPGQRSAARHPFRLAADVVLEDSEVKPSSSEPNLGIDAMWKKILHMWSILTVALTDTHTHIPCSVTRRWTEDTGILQCFLPPMAWAQRKMEFQDTGGIHFTLCSHRDKTAFDLLYRQSVFYLLIKRREICWNMC